MGDSNTDIIVILSSDDEEEQNSANSNDLSRVTKDEEPEQKSPSLNRKHPTPKKLNNSGHKLPDNISNNFSMESFDNYSLFYKFCSLCQARLKTQQQKKVIHFLNKRFSQASRVYLESSPFRDYIDEAITSVVSDPYNVYVHIMSVCNELRGNRQTTTGDDKVNHQHQQHEQERGSSDKDLEASGHSTQPVMISSEFKDTKSLCGITQTNGEKTSMTNNTMSSTDSYRAMIACRVVISPCSEISKIVPSSETTTTIPCTDTTKTVSCIEATDTVPSSDGSQIQHYSESPLRIESIRTTDMILHDAADANNLLHCNSSGTETLVCTPTMTSSDRAVKASANLMHNKQSGVDVPCSAETKTDHNAKTSGTSSFTNATAILPHDKLNGSSCDGEDVTTQEDSIEIHVSQPSGARPSDPPCQTYTAVSPSLSTTAQSTDSFPGNDAAQINDSAMQQIPSVSTAFNQDSTLGKMGENSTALQRDSTTEKKSQNLDKKSSIQEIDSLPENHDKELTRKECKVKRHIRKLEKLLEKINKEIKRLQSQELSLDDLAEEDSAYILEDHYTKKATKIWTKICELKRTSKNTGREIEKKFVFQGSRYPEINKRISRFVNRKRIFPDFHDVTIIVERTNQEKSLGIAPSFLPILTQEVFRDVGAQLKKRRIKDFELTFGSYLTDEVNPDADPALDDGNLHERLSKNRELSEKNMNDVLYNFTAKQADSRNEPLSSPDREAAEEQEENSAVSDENQEDNNYDDLTGNEEEDDEAETKQDNDASSCSIMVCEESQLTDVFVPESEELVEMTEAEHETGPQNETTCSQEGSVIILDEDSNMTTFAKHEPGNSDKRRLNIGGSSQSPVIESQASSGGNVTGGSKRVTDAMDSVDDVNIVQQCSSTSEHSDITGGIKRKASDMDDSDVQHVYDAKRDKVRLSENNHKYSAQLLDIKKGLKCMKSKGDVLGKLFIRAANSDKQKTDSSNQAQKLTTVIQNETVSCLNENLPICTDSSPPGIKDALLNCASTRQTNDSSEKYERSHDSTAMLKNNHGDSKLTVTTNDLLDIPSSDAFVKPNHTNECIIID